MKRTSFLIVGLASSIALSGCIQGMQPRSEAPQPEPVVQKPAPVEVAPMRIEPKMVEQKKPEKPELLKITGIGYGAESTFAAYTPGQRRLMAIRSSKLDAYRALAEQLYGIKIDRLQQQSWKPRFGDHC